MKKKKNTYHHGNLAESLLDAVDQLAMQFGMEAVTLRACAKLVGVSPSSAFRHYTDKRDLMTAFAARALRQLAHAMEETSKQAQKQKLDPFNAVGLAYIKFALDKPALFRAMWNEETIYADDERYLLASAQLATHLHGGFAGTIEDTDADNLNSTELLAWSAVHGLASLMIDGPLYRKESKRKRLNLATNMLARLREALADDLLQE